MAKILIADDEINLQNLIKTVLEEGKHQVLTVTRGSDVIAALQREKPDLLILDVMLPAMDGLSLQKIIAQDPALRAVPIIVITAQKAFLGMFSAFPQVAAKLEKPFTMQTLIATVDSILNRKQSPAVQ